MKCPKCKAKVGVMKQHIVAESGEADGILCYICGFWVQEYPEAVH